MDRPGVKGPGVKGEGDTEFVVSKFRLWGILSDVTGQSSKSRMGQADFSVGMTACLHANQLRRVDALSHRTI